MINSTSFIYMTFYSFFLSFWPPSIFSLLFPACNRQVLHTSFIDRHHAEWVSKLLRRLTLWIPDMVLRRDLWSRFRQALKHCFTKLFDYNHAKKYPNIPEIYLDWYVLFSYESIMATTILCICSERFLVIADLKGFQCSNTILQKCDRIIVWQYVYSN